VLGYVIDKPRKKDEGHPRELVIPADLRRRLGAWVDVEEVGADGFWLWLRAVIPLLPNPGAAGKGPAWAGGPWPEDVRELKHRLVVYAREHARLSVICDQHSRDNQTLSRRLKALEAALRTLEMAGHTVEIPVDEEVGEVSDRYLPARRRKGRYSSSGANPPGPRAAAETARRDSKGE